MRAHSGRRAAAAGGVGQVVITATGTTSWTVPDGVTSLCVVLVQPGHDGSNTAATLQAGSTILCRAQTGSRIGDGGGDGGAAGVWVYDPDYPTAAAGAGGGAGGYAGPGGPGGNGVPLNGNISPGAGGAGSGGAGGGGGGGRTALAGGRGGGVGLLGQGASGAAQPTLGAAGNVGSGGDYGWGAGGAVGTTGRYGGALSYKNAIAVTPGQVLTITIPATTYGGIGACRLIWGDGRAFPSTNTQDL